MPLKTERRTQLRKRPLSLVYVELPPSNGGMMRDLSEEGFSLRAMMPVSPSEKVPFSFVLDNSARIDGEAIVLRVEDGGHVAAFKFAGLPSHSRDQIRRWLDKLDEPISPEASPVQSKEPKHLSLTELRSQVRAPQSTSPASSASQSAPSPPPPKVPPPEPEPPPVPSPPVAEISSPPPQVLVPPPIPEPPSPPVLAAVEATPPPPIVAASQGPEPAASLFDEISQPPPAPTGMSLPKPSPPSPQEPPPLPVSRSTMEQPNTPPLPPLLRLSSVRPGPPLREISVEPTVPIVVPKPAAEPPARIQVSLPKPEPAAATEARIPDPPAAATAPHRRLIPPPLEPLSSLEGETDSDTPGWMDRFTIGRAIGIMLFLTLLAGSYVYHREVGQALIWLGHQIAGDDSPESSKVAPTETPVVTHPIPEPTAPARAVPPPPLTVQQSPDTSESKSANLPAASDKTPSPQLKNATPGSFVPLTQFTRPPVPAPSVDNPADAGQQEHLEALQILRSPSRASEVPAAIQLLWVAVEKGNTGAEIDLAELFRTGRGVAKNCDQTQILLSAAARKGSVEARKRLEAFRREGCRN